MDFSNIGSVLSNALANPAIQRALISGGARKLNQPRVPYKRNWTEELGGGIEAGFNAYDEAIKRQLDVENKRQEMDLAKKLYSLKKSEHDLESSKIEYALNKGKRIKGLFDKPIGIQGGEQMVDSGEYANYQPEDTPNIITKQLVPGRELTVKDAIASALKNPAYAELLPGFMEEGISVPGEWFKETDPEKKFKEAIYNAIGSHLQGGGSLESIPNELKKGAGLFPGEESVDEYGKFLRSRGLQNSPENERRFIQYQRELGVAKGEGRAVSKDVPVGYYKEGKTSLTSKFISDLGKDLDDFTNPITGEISDSAIRTNLPPDVRRKYESAIELMDDYLNKGMSPNKAAAAAYKTIMGSKIPDTLDKSKSELKGKSFKSSSGKEFKLPY